MSYQEGKEFADNSLIVGSPARAVRTLDEAAAAGITASAKAYVARWLTPGQAAPPVREKAAKVDSYIGAPVTGREYFALEHDCAPFTECATCAPVLAKSGWRAANDAVRAMLAAMPAR